MSDIPQLDGLECGERTILYVLGLLEELREKGMVSGPTMLTPEGRALLPHLKASGFNPTTEEINEAMAHIQSLLTRGPQ